MNGIVVVDKPGGLSSAGVVARVKKIYAARKVGHAGTLDPMATGVLICCLNRATRLSRFLLGGDKTYEAELALGVDTDTQDATGSIVAQHPLTGISEARVRSVAAGFVGPITQVPPVYSALKHQGTPLYKLARRGKAVEKPARPVRIKRLDIIDVHLPRVRFVVGCSSGTYIRTLCADMGKALGCGGHLKQLRRISSSEISIRDAWELDHLLRWRDAGRLAETVVSMNAALPSTPLVVADEQVAHKINHGMPLVAADFATRPQVSDQGVFKVVDQNHRLLAVISEARASSNYNYCCVFSVQGG